MSVVAVTGISGHLGRAFGALLAGRDDVTRIVGIDLVDPPPGPALEFYRADLRSAGLADVLRGCDVLVHLAYAVAPMRDEAEMRDINVGGTENVFRAAVAAGVRKIVYTSSAMVYGAHPDNDVPLTEDSPVRPVRDFSYSAHKGECEAFVDDFRRAHPDVVVTVLRPAVLLGPDVTGLLAQIVEAPVVPVVAGYDPEVQALHTDDAARALVHALTNDLDGAYNVCADDSLTSQEWADIVGRRRLTMSPEGAARQMERLWGVGLSTLPPGFLPFLMYPWVMSNERFVATGFSFERSSADALRDAAAARAGRVAVGRYSFRPLRALAVGAGAALIAGSVARRVTRPRRG